MKKFTVKDKIIISVLASAIVIGSAVAIAAEIHTSGYTYSKNEAKQIALDFFELSEADIKKTKSELDDGVYEFEFKTAENKYECDVNAATGKISDIEVKSYGSENSGLNTYSSENNFISADEAKKIAFESFEIPENAAVTHFTSELDNYKYEIEFKLDGVEYECDINAFTGEIIKSKIEDKKAVSSGGNTIKNNSIKEEVKPNNTVPQSAVSVEAVKSAAVKHFGIPEDTKLSELEISRESRKYEVEFKLNGVEYECDADLYNGEITNPKIEGYDGTVSSYLAANGYISLDTAVETALAYLKISASDYDYTEFEFEHGKYELEFKAKNFKRECEINAVTGEIVK